MMATSIAIRNRGNYQSVARVQGWDEGHAAVTGEGKQGAEVAAACLREVCSRVQSLGERFYPNDVRPMQAPSKECSSWLQRSHLQDRSLYSSPRNLHQ